jgi:hypothetical protein
MNVFVVRDRFTPGPGKHVFETTNGGATWTDVTVNLPNLPTSTILIDPRTGFLYVGNDTGVFMSPSAGSPWTRFGSSLPNAQVIDLELNPTLGILAASTRGRGVFEIQVTGMAHSGLVPTPVRGSAETTFPMAITALEGIIDRVPDLTPPGQGMQVVVVALNRVNTQNGSVADSTSGASGMLTQTENTVNTPSTTVSFLPPSACGQAEPVPDLVNGTVEELKIGLDVKPLS